MVLLYRGDSRRGQAWRSFFRRCMPDVEFRIWPEIGDPADIRYLAVWEPVDNVGDRFPNLEVLFSTGAGVDQFDLSAIPPRIEVVRLIDPAIVTGMREYVSMSVLAVHRDLLDYRQAQAQHNWRPLRTKAASEVRVGTMGLGVLGRAVLDALRPFGYSLSAWSRLPHDVDGVSCFSGTAGLRDFARSSNIIVCLLPLTSATRGILDRPLFDDMPRGGGLINVGRGGHLQEKALLSALDDGQLSGAVLDVFDEEPLPADHPFWTHDRIILTPHIASQTGYDSAANELVENIRRHQQGKPMVGVVDRESGY